MLSSRRRPTLTAFICCAVLLFLSARGVVASARGAQAAPIPDKARLNELAQHFARDLKVHRGAAYLALLRSESPAQKALLANPGLKLMYADDRGRPVYYALDNLTAAATVSTNKVWPSGGYGFYLTGSGTAVGELGIWDGGSVRASHQELTGRVTQVDSPSGSSAHATHVAGTMVAGGVVSVAKGMSYQADLTCYDYDNDNSEMAAAAAGGMKASNHSYTTLVGWYYDGPTSQWYWFGDTDISETEDYYFGFYDSEAQAWDQIAADAPYYTIVGSAGNNRDEVGPGPGGGHWVWDNDIHEWVWSTTTRDPDGGADGYDSMAHTKVAKNVLSIGAVNDIPAGYSAPADVVMTSFSSWGPTDDGRIKPDLVANGTGLYSCTNISNSSYASYNGTSMSAPNVTGSLNLLVHYFESSHGGRTPLSSTMKAILVQTADEAGANAGPDYKFGWGLMNTRAAAGLINSDSTSSFWIREDTLSSAEKDTLYVYNQSTTAIRLTLAWTDPPGTPPSPSLNPTTPMLVDDLDLRMERVGASTTYYPYVLDQANPSGAATTGDNTRDNVEQIYLASAPAGCYRITVSHKSWLPEDQAYSLAASQKMSLTADRTPPVVAVLRPNGGELFREATQDTVRWEASDEVGVDSVSIYYSTDGGATYPDAIATGEANDGEYLWTVPATHSTSCKVKVVAYDWSQNAGADTSDADFTIAPPLDVTPPEVTVVKPNGGEVFYVALGDTIKWVATDNVGVDHVDIYYSTDGGASYPYTVSTGEPNDSTYLWTVPPTPSDSCVVKVAAFDAELNSSADTSDVEFTIADVTPPEVAVVRPNGGEVFYVADEDTIRWVATDELGVDSVSIYYSTDGGVTFPYTIATGEANDSLYVWEVPSTPSATCVVRVLAYDAALNSGADTSDAPFTIETEVGVDLTPGAAAFGLSQNYPNPFNPVTRTEFSLASSSRVTLRVYDVSGKLVRTLVDEVMGAGAHSAVWDGNDDAGRAAASGVYVTRLTAEGRTASRKNVLLR